MNALNLKYMNEYSAYLLDGQDDDGIDTEATEDQFNAMVEAAVAERFSSHYEGGLDAEDVSITAYYAAAEYGTVQHGADAGFDIDALEYDESEEGVWFREIGLTRGALDTIIERIFSEGEFYVLCE